MDAALRPEVIITTLPLFYQVSILVLVDAALRPDTVTPLSKVTSFNPCFSGCRPATCRGGTVRRSLHRVSILVLVDAALRLISHQQTSMIALCFNPCFSGCRPATHWLRSSRIAQPY